MRIAWLPLRRAPGRKAGETLVELIEREVEDRGSTPRTSTNFEESSA